MDSNNETPKEKEEELEEEIDDEIEEEKVAKNDDNIMRTKMIKLMILFMLVFFILLVVLWVVSIISPKKYTYEDVETVLEKAAIAYFADYPESLPQSEKQGVEVDYTNLVAAEKMKPLSEYVGDNNCSAYVQVQKAGDDYLYTPYLNCGEEYTTMELYKAVQSQGTVHQGEYGLYHMNGEYVYRGEKVNNYVELDEGLWRIVKVTSKNNVVLVKDEQAGSTVPYDDRYNKDKQWSSGINSFSASRLKDAIENMYQDPNKDLNEVFLSNKDKKRIVAFNLCIGKRGEQDTGHDNTLECKQVQSNTKVGLLTVSDYLKASIDTNCTNSISKSCSNYNYLKTDFSWWLVTANSETTSEAFNVTNTGVIESDTTSSYAYIRPVVYLNERTMYKSGKGTKSKPFILK